MSMLARYRRPGGIVQLVNLLETSDVKKREKLLKVIREEDPEMAENVSQKVLTAEIIFSWPQEIIAEITTRIPEKVLVYALHGLPEGSFQKATSTMPNVKAHEMSELYKSLSPSSGEINSSIVKIITKVRELDKEGILQLKHIDPKLSLEDAA